MNGLIGFLIDFVCACGEIIGIWRNPPRIVSAQAATAIASPSIPPTFQPYNRDSVIAERQRLISEAFNSNALQEERQRLVNAMVEPIRRSLEYEAIGRRLLTVEPLPSGAQVQFVTSEPRYFSISAIMKEKIDYPNLLFINKSFRKGLTKPKIVVL